MAAITFDTLSVARRLKQAGMSAELAEAQAEIMAETFVHNTDALVTKDYLDARFGEFEARMDARLGEFEAGVNARFASIDLRFAQIDGKFRLLYWMQALIIASTVIPAISKLLL